MSEQILWAIRNGDLDQLKALKFDANELLMAGRYPLHVAADYGHVDVGDYLIQQGANVNQLDKHGISPLLCAIFEHHTQFVKLLLKHGADKNTKMPDGRTCYDVAESDEIRQLLK